MFQTSLTDVVFPYRFFSLIFFSKKKTFRNRWLNFSIMGVTFKWLLHFYIYIFIFIFYMIIYFPLDFIFIYVFSFLRYSELIPNINSKINANDLALFFLFTCTVGPKSTVFSNFFLQFQSNFFQSCFADGISWESEANVDKFSF